MPEAGRTLIVRPARNLLEGHRYVVGLRDLVGEGGAPIVADPTFAALRDGTAGGSRQTTSDEHNFPALDPSRIHRARRLLAWDLTVPSADNLAGRALSMPHPASPPLGDPDQIGPSSCTEHG